MDPTRTILLAVAPPVIALVACLLCRRWVLLGCLALLVLLADRWLLLVFLPRGEASHVLYRSLTVASVVLALGALFWRGWAQGRGEPAVSASRRWPRGGRGR